MTRYSINHLAIIGQIGFALDGSMSFVQINTDLFLVQHRIGLSQKKKVKRTKKKTPKFLQKVQTTLQTILQDLRPHLEQD